jgi:hypothetical protein
LFAKIMLMQKEEQLKWPKSLEDRGSDTHLSFAADTPVGSIIKHVGGSTTSEKAEQECDRVNADVLELLTRPDTTEWMPWLHDLLEWFQLPPSESIGSGSTVELSASVNFDDIAFIKFLIEDLNSSRLVTGEGQFRILDCKSDPNVMSQFDNWTRQQDGGKPATAPASQSPTKAAQKAEMVSEGRVVFIFYAQLISPEARRQILCACVSSQPQWKAIFVESYLEPKHYVVEMRPLNSRSLVKMTTKLIRCRYSVHGVRKFLAHFFVEDGSDWPTDPLADWPTGRPGNPRSDFSCIAHHDGETHHTRLVCGLR